MNELKNMEIMFLFQDDFIDKNRKVLPNGLRMIIHKSSGLFEASIIKSKSNCTTASRLKFEIDNLVEKLKETVIDSNELYTSINR